MKAPVWIEERDALGLHNRLIGLYGGLAGLRDKGLLQSALARPQQLYAYAEQFDLIDLAAAYITGIVRNHPFNDGNKRTGFVAGVLFLEINERFFVASEEEATRAVLGIAAGDMGESEFTLWLRANVRG